MPRHVFLTRFTWNLHIHIHMHDTKCIFSSVVTFSIFFFFSLTRDFFFFNNTLYILNQGSTGTRPPVSRWRNRDPENRLGLSLSTRKNKRKNPVERKESRLKGSLPVTLHHQKYAANDDDLNKSSRPLHLRVLLKWGADTQFRESPEFFTSNRRIKVGYLKRTAPLGITAIPN